MSKGSFIRLLLTYPWKRFATMAVKQHSNNSQSIPTELNTTDHVLISHQIMCGFWNLTGEILKEH